MNTVIISGSPRKQGRTRIAARYLTDKMNAPLIDLSDLNLPIFNGEKAQDQLAEVQWLRQVVDGADAFIWLSPEYHNGMSGALKNALDFLEIDDFHHKPTLLFSVSGGGKGGINSINQMRLVARGLHALVLPEQLVFDPGSFIDRKALTKVAEEKVEKVLSEFQKYLLVRS